MSSTSPATPMTPRMSSPVRAWLNDSLTSFTSFTVSALQDRRRASRVHHHHRLAAVHREAGRRLGPEAAYRRRQRPDAQLLHHTQDLVGRQGGAAATADPDPVIRPRAHQPVDGGVGDPPQAAAAAQQQVAAGVGDAQVARPSASRLRTRTTSPPTGASPSRKPPSPATTDSEGTCTTSSAESAARPSISRASAGPTQTTTVTG